MNSEKLQRHQRDTRHLDSTNTIQTQNWKNKTIFTGDNLYIMRGMNSESVDLIYLDPPFNSNKAYAAPVGSQAAGAAFKDTWTLSDVDLMEAARLQSEYGKGLFQFLAAAEFIHSKGMRSYLTMMASRLVEMKRILKSTGSVYVHCDPTANHYLKGLMDAIFGKTNFRNEIIWSYRGMPSNAKKWQQKHDTILFYTVSKNFTFNVQFDEPTEGSLKTFETGKKVGYNANHKKKMVTVFDWKKYYKAVKDGKLPPDLQPKEFTGGLPPMRDVWHDIKILGGSKNKERTGYPTQKPLSLLHRIIKTSSNESDVVFDPFCGCATALVAADDLHRQWVGVDLSHRAVELLTDRIKNHQGIFLDITATRLKPKRTDLEPELSPLEKKMHKGALFALQEQICNGCGVWFSRIQDFEMDHITPITHGGTNHKHNFQLLCGNCNKKKGKKSQEEFMALMQETRARNLNI